MAEKKRITEINDKFEDILEETRNQRALLQYRFEFAEGEQNNVLDTRKNVWEIKRKQEQFILTDSFLDEWVTKHIALLLNPDRVFRARPQDSKYYDQNIKAECAEALANAMYEKMIDDGVDERLAYYDSVAGLGYAKITTKPVSNAMYGKWKNDRLRTVRAPGHDISIMAVMPQRIFVDPHFENIEDADCFFHVEPFAISDAAALLGKTEKWIEDNLLTVQDQLDLRQQVSRISERRSVWWGNDPVNFYEISNSTVNLEENKVYLIEYWENYGGGDWMRTILVKTKNMKDDTQGNTASKIIAVDDFPFLPFVQFKWTRRDNGMYPTSPIARAITYQKMHNILIHSVWQIFDTNPKNYTAAPLTQNLEFTKQPGEVIKFHPSTKQPIQHLHGFQVPDSIWNMIAYTDGRIRAKLGQVTPIMGGPNDKVRTATEIVQAGEGEELTHLTGKKNFVRALERTMYRALQMAQLIWDPMTNPHIPLGYNRLFPMTGIDEAEMVEWFDGTPDDVRVRIDATFEQDLPIQHKIMMANEMEKMGQFGPHGTFKARLAKEEFLGRSAYQFVTRAERTARSAARKVLSIIRKYNEMLNALESGATPDFYIAPEQLIQIIMPKMGQNSEVFVAEIETFMSSPEFIHMRDDVKQRLVQVFQAHMEVIAAQIEAQKEAISNESGPEQQREPDLGAAAEPISSSGRIPVVGPAGNGNGTNFPSAAGQGLGGAASYR